jgi:hypothetical protein
MESEGRSPLRILRHALIIAEVFTTVLFLSTESPPTTRGKIPTESGNAASANRFGGKYVALGLTLSPRKHRNRALTIGNTGSVELRVPGEMDRPRVPLGQSNH